MDDKKTVFRSFADDLQIVFFWRGEEKMRQHPTDESRLHFKKKQGRA